MRWLDEYAQGLTMLQAMWAKGVQKPAILE